MFDQAKYGIFSQNLQTTAGLPDIDTSTLRKKKAYISELELTCNKQPLCSDAQLGRLSRPVASSFSNKNAVHHNHDPLRLPYHPKPPELLFLIALITTKQSRPSGYLSYATTPEIRRKQRNPVKHPKSANAYLSIQYVACLDWYVQHIRWQRRRQLQLRLVHLSDHPGGTSWSDGTSERGHQ